MIGIFDSGIGGLTILNEIKKIITHNNILYYADYKNHPYGNKADKDLRIITSSAIDYLIQNRCNIIVIACNTATTKCISYLRKKYPNITFIGTEPAIKSAYDDNHKNTLVLATIATTKSKNLHNLVKKYKHNNQNIYVQACEKLAETIEKNNNEEINNLLRKYLSSYQNIDSIVLGCTHYPYIKKQISNFFPTAAIYDSSKGVAKELKRVLITKNLLKKSGKQNIKIIKNL